jgi:hypothetical protein
MRLRYAYRKFRRCGSIIGSGVGGAAGAVFAGGAPFPAAVAFPGAAAPPGAAAGVEPLPVSS